MKKYAKVNQQGFIEYIVQSVCAQEGLVEIEYNIGTPPDSQGWMKFNINSMTWEDPRTVDEKTEEESRRARQIRGSFLSSCDWTQLPDVPLQTKEAWAIYRQALRDITEQQGYPFNVIWPTPPG